MTQKLLIPDKVTKVLKKYTNKLSSPLVYINSAKQKMLLCENEKCIKEFNISTALKGIGNKQDSNQTPPGLHRVCKKIGDGAPIKRIFKSRKDTGQDCSIDDTSENLILTRILRLEGMEDGVNKGPGIDSYERYIYIHGTNREDLIGQPMSHGCICMKNNDILWLFNAIQEGTYVYID